MLLGPAGGVNGGLESARSKGVLGFDGIKVWIEWLVDCCIHILSCNGVCNSRPDDADK